MLAGDSPHHTVFVGDRAFLWDSRINRPEQVGNSKNILEKGMAAPKTWYGMNRVRLYVREGGRGWRPAGPERIGLCVLSVKAAHATGFNVEPISGSGQPGMQLGLHLQVPL